MLGQQHAAKSTDCLLEWTIGEFLRASSLIASTNDDLYSRGSEALGSVGAHIRHNFDIANNFLTGLRTGKIDYTLRERDSRIEQDRLYAIDRISDLTTGLRCIPVKVFSGPVAVRSEIDDAVWHSSSVTRELEFVHSHTVHHHALVAEKLKAFGFKVADDFGVAPSTLKFWAETKHRRVTNASIAGAAKL